MRLDHSSSTISRRGILAGAGGLAAWALAGCGSAGTDSGGGSGWEFTDDLGKKISLDKRPERLFAFTSCAAALWDFGARPTGVFGPHRTSSGDREIIAGNIDLSKVKTVSNTYDAFNPEKLLAMKPDLVVTGLAGTQAKDRWVLQEQLASKIEPVVPIVSISEYKLTLPEVIQRYAKLAKALGADVDAPAIKAAKAEFDRASDELRAAVREKPGLKVEVVYGDQSNMYVARPSFYADLAWYRELGMQFVNCEAFRGRGGGAEDYLEMLSWEEAAKYAADLILTDARAFSLTPQEMSAQFPTWRALPAVRQGQLGKWLGEPRFSYQLAAPEIRRLTENVRGSKVGIASA